MLALYAAPVTDNLLRVSSKTVLQYSIIIFIIAQCGQEK